MLLSQCRRQTVQSFVCWRCLASRPNTRPKARRGTNPTRRYLSGSPTVFSTVEDRQHTANDHFLPPTPPHKRAFIREQLQQWELENAPLYVPELEQSTTTPSDVHNTLGQGVGRVETQIAEDGAMSIFEDQDLIDIGSGRKVLLRGDLVELRSGRRSEPELAIYVRQLESQAQFYTMSGKYLHQSAGNALFYIPNFIQRKELDDILPYLPDTDVPEALEEEPQDLPDDVPAAIGGPILTKMTDFWLESQAIHQAAIARLENAHKIASNPHDISYATLDQLATLLLSPVLSRTEYGNFPGPALYAVHQAVTRADTGFNTLHTGGTLRAGGAYEMLSRHEHKHFRNVLEEVRNFQAGLLDNKRSSGMNLRAFITKCQSYIDESRKFRNLTPHGTLVRKAENAGKESSKRGKFSSDEVWILRFFKHWAGFQTFSPQSIYNGIGSTILRAIDRYKEMPLDRNTGWTFLQEVGFIKPWQQKAIYDMRLTSERAPVMDTIPDKLASHRKDWKSLAAFCVDEPSALELDDAMSIEPTETPNEYWIRIHIADPAAHLDPQGAAAQYARSLTETVYMPELVVPLLNGADSLSLAPDRPCLTFSARMNLEGDILDIDVAPGTLRNVIYMSYPSLDKVVGRTGTPTVTHVVGDMEILKTTPSRIMTEPDQLDDKYKQELRLLDRIATARGKKLRARGGVTINHPDTSISLSFPSESPNGPNKFPCDPTIQITHPVYNSNNTSILTTEVSTVERVMLICNEIAARWCHARGIPIPYRVTPRNPDKEPPIDYYRREILPAMERDGAGVPEALLGPYLLLIGPVHASVEAGPHSFIGVDMVTKATSPLRRYGDMLVHWQIEAALLKEVELGQSLIGNTDDGFLPFSKAAVNEYIPELDSRERIIKKAKRSASRFWYYCFLLRAWKYNEAKLPSTFQFVIRNLRPFAGKGSGEIPELYVGAVFEAPEWLSIEEIKLGDVFEVEFDDINVFNQRIIVKLLRRLEKVEGSGR